ncbi:MAG: methyltransferase domain-containing protein [Nanoarchaeota archaeon]
MRYLFILGRNVQLSIKELFCFLEREENPVLNFLESKNAVIVELEKSLPKDILKNLGGVIAIGEILSSGSIKQIIDELEKKQVYLGTKNNFNYSVWDFSSEDSLTKISLYLKQRFRDEKLKASEKKLSRAMVLQDGRVVNIPSSRLIDIEYFVFGDKDLYFGIVKEKCDYEDIEARDMNKPVRREQLSISPRIAKIMINLSGVREGGKLLDPFCGVGTILQEALIQHIQVAGIDIDKEAIEGARPNLKHSKFSEKDYLLILNDSRKASVGEYDVIVTEPDLGELLRDIPTKRKAEEIISKFENLIISVINNLKKSVSGRIVFTAPLIKIGDRRISCSASNISKRTNMKIVEGFPLPDYRKDQIVGRDIFVLERIDKN